MQSDVGFSVLQLAFHVMIGRIRLLSFYDSTALFFFLVALSLPCSARVSHCGGISCCRAQTLSVRASVVVALRLSCSVACEILLDQGSNPWFLHWQVDSYPLHHQGSLTQPFFRALESSASSQQVGEEKVKKTSPFDHLTQIQPLLHYCWQKVITG